jgi:hypothetical protein
VNHGLRAAERDHVAECLRLGRRLSAVDQKLFQASQLIVGGHARRSCAPTFADIPKLAMKIVRAIHA